MFPRPCNADPFKHQRSHAHNSQSKQFLSYDQHHVGLDMSMIHLRMSRSVDILRLQDVCSHVFPKSSIVSLLNLRRSIVVCSFLDWHPSNLICWSGISGHCSILTMLEKRRLCESFNSSTYWEGVRCVQTWVHSNTASSIVCWWGDSRERKETQDHLRSPQQNNG